MQTDLDLMRLLSQIKDPKQLESQKELLQIKEVKRNLSEKLMKVYLPTGYAEFFQILETIDYYDKPDYDRLIKIFEKSRDMVPFFPKSKANCQQLADPELFELDPLFLKFNEQLVKHKQSRVYFKS